MLKEGMSEAGLVSAPARMWLDGQEHTVNRDHFLSGRHKLVVNHPKSLERVLTALDLSMLDQLVSD